MIKINSTDCPGDQVYGFGAGKRGQLGISMNNIKSINLPQVTCGLEDIKITAISANGDHSAAISGESKSLFFCKNVDKSSIYYL